MAKSDVILYYLQCENDYLEMMDNLKEMQELALDGKIDEEDCKQLEEDVKIIKSNYERIAYIIMLLNKPNRKNNEKADMNRSWYNALRGSSREALLDENRDALADFKKRIGK